MSSASTAADPPTVAVTTEGRCQETKEAERANKGKSGKGNVKSKGKGKGKLNSVESSNWQEHADLLTGSRNVTITKKMQSMLMDGEMKSLRMDG